MAVASGPEGSRTWYAASSNSMVGAEEIWFGKQEQIRRAGKILPPTKTPSNDKKELVFHSSQYKGQLACSIYLPLSNAWEKNNVFVIP